MGTITRWVVPSYHFRPNYSLEPIEFDFTSHFKTMLSNEVWNRKFDYGFGTGLENTDKEDIKSVNVSIYPRFLSGYVNEGRLSEIIEKRGITIPNFSKVDSYKNWTYRWGLTIIEVEYNSDTKCIPTEEDLTKDVIPHYSEEFVVLYNRHLAVLKEVAAFLLAGLHLGYPTSSIMISEDDPTSDGFIHIQSGDLVHCSYQKTSKFMHEIFIDTDKKILDSVNAFYAMLATVWHHNLWPLKRYLVAVESDRTNMDDLLDLIFALEGLFTKNASSDFIKMMCITVGAKDREQALHFKNILDAAYTIRNNIAHGEKSYNIMDKIKVGGKEILAQDVYWEMKGIVATMIVKAILKLMENREMKNLRFTNDDLLNKLFKPKVKKAN